MYDVYIQYPILTSTSQNGQLLFNWTNGINLWITGQLKVFNINKIQISLIFIIKYEYIFKISTFLKYNYFCSINISLEMEEWYISCIIIQITFWLGPMNNRAIFTVLHNTFYKIHRRGGKSCEILFQTEKNNRITKLFCTLMNGTQRTASKKCC